MAANRDSAITDEILDQLLNGRDPATVFESGGLVDELKKRLADLSLVNMGNIPKDRIAFGSRVVLYDIDRDAEIEYRLVTSEEADLSKGLISTTSPIGRGLMGKRVGDTVRISTPNGTREFEVKGMQTIHEQ